MKKLTRLLIIAVALLMVFTSPVQAHGGGHGHGGGWGWGPALGLGLFGLGVWELSQPHYYPYYYTYPAPVIQQPAQEIYVQPAPPVPANTGYWYYCRNPEGYYPYVKRCPNGWLKVMPTPPE